MKKLLVGLFVFSFLVVGLKVSIAEAVDSQVTLFLGNTQSVVFNGQNLELELKTLDGSTGIYSLEVNGILKSASSFGTELSITDSVSLKGISYSTINSVTQSVTLQLLEKITPSITVLSPNGGEVYQAGQQIIVKYKMTNNDSQVGDKVSIFLKSLYDNSIYNFGSFRAEVVGDDSIVLTIPTNSNLVTGNYYKISARFTGSNGFVSQDESDNAFTINSATNSDCISTSAPSTTMIYPRGGEIFKAGQQITVKWQSCNVPATSNVNIDFSGSQDWGAAYTTSYGIDLVRDTPNDGQEIVTLPPSLSSSDFAGITWGKYFKIRVLPSRTQANVNSSDPFTITSSTIITPSTTEDGCSNGVFYSYTTGQECPRVVAPVTYTDDLTPRISYWYGKVNQHVSIREKMWQTDPDGVSGANIDKLSYCKKWYPNTTSVTEYKMETINAWHDRGNVNDYKGINMSYRCVQKDNGCSNGEVYSSTTGQKCSGITTPSITVLSPNGGEVYKEGDIVRVKWTSSNLPADYRINLVFNYLDELKDEYKQSVLITKAEDKGYYDYKLPMFFQYKTSNYPLPGKNYEFTAYLFDSSLFNAPSSNAVAIGSSAHGSNDGFFTINVLNTFTPDTSCSAGEVYSSVTGKKCFEKYEVKDTGCIAGQNYSSMTGKPCALGLYKKDNTDVLNPITSSITRTLKVGVKGDDVKALQAFLNLLADGSFGPKTQAKVMEWQAAHGLTADGVFGRMSREKAGLIQ